MEGGLNEFTVNYDDGRGPCVGFSGWLQRGWSVTCGKGRLIGHVVCIWSVTGVK